MVGKARRGGGPAAGLTPAELTAAGLTPAELTAAGLTAGLVAGYDAAAQDWAGGPGLMYARLAQALVAAAPVPLAGLRVLDLGAGAGVGGQAALAAGARQVVAADLSVAMLRRGAPQLPPDQPPPDQPPPDQPPPDQPLQPAAWLAVAADATALPFRDQSFRLVLAAFCLNHLVSLAAGLSEARRVGAAIAASMFAPGWTHPAKDAVDEVLRSAGYQPPAWYAALRPGSRASDPAELAAAATAAGFTQVRLRTIDVATGLAAPAELVSWRLGMAQYAPFVRSLDPPRRAELRRAAERAVAGAGPLDVSMTVLTAS